MSTKMEFQRVGALGNRIAELVDTPGLTFIGFNADGEVHLYDQAEVGGALTEGETIGATSDDVVSSAVAVDTVVGFKVVVSAVDDLGNAAIFEAKGGIKNLAGTTSLVGTPAIEMICGDTVAWATADNVQVTADNSADKLLVTVTGSAGRTVSWKASAQYVSV